MKYHNIKPVYNKESKVLILGSFPSVKSREAEFFYHHPQNRFWKIFENLYDVRLDSIENKKLFLLEHNIAIWDVIESCEIQGSSDSSIKKVKTNNILELINNSNIKTIYTNGKKAEQLYKKYCEKDTRIKSICLPSTSPANAIYSLEKLIKEWRKIKDNISQY
jgi:G:T/U mismatch-specific DNA glycosylase